MRFTKEQMAFLKDYELWMNTAVHCDYVRAIPTSMSSKVADLWRKVREPDYVFNPNCGMCVLNLFKKVGTVYYAQMDAEAQKKKRTGKKKE